MIESDVRDDRVTVVAMGGLAYMLQSMLHEGLGHGVTAWLSGAHRIILSTVALDSDVETRWISANGTVVNLAAALVLWIVLRWADRFPSGSRYFLILAFAGNLFMGTGYFLFSGVAGFGDWEAVIHGLHPYWLFRAGLVVLGVVSYGTAMWMVARELNPYARDDRWSRMTRLTWTPYFAEGALAAVAGLLNPAGAIYVLLSALPATLGANSGLLWIRYYVPLPVAGNEAEPIQRSYGWITVAVLCGLVFVFWVGRGIESHL